MLGPLRTAADSVRLAAAGLWHRRGVSLAILLVAVVTVLAAALGPLYARAGGESVLQDTLRAAPAREVGLELSAASLGSQHPLEALQYELQQAGRLPGYLPAVAGLQYTGTVIDARGQPVASSLLVHRTGFCRHLRLQSGRCPRPGEIAVSARSLATYPWRLGTMVLLPPFPPLRVVGLYSTANRSDPYWFSRDYFNAHISVGAGGSDPPNVSDSLFTPLGTFSRARSDYTTRAVIDLPLDVRTTRLRDVPRLTRQLAPYRLALAATDLAPQDESNLDGVLQRARASISQLNVAVLLVVGQLLLLSWFVLFLVVANASEARGPEVALAKLRGLSAAGTVAFGLLEPVLLLLLAVPLGLLLAVLAAAALAHVRLLPGTPLVVTRLTLLGAAAALAGALTAAALAARATLRRPVVEQWRRVAGERSGTGGGRYADLVVVAAAVALLVRLALVPARAGGRLAGLALLAPGLVALTLGLVSVRLLPVACRAAVARSRGSRRIGRFLALRQVSRRSGSFRVVVLLAVAFALMTFAGTAASVSARNRAARAATAVGASTVLTVEASPGVDLVAAVRRLDPHGRYAMAAADYQPFGDQPGGRLLAVDSARLTAVASWRRDFTALPLGRLAADLHPATAPSVRFTGTRIAVRVTGLSVTGSRPVSLVAGLDSPTRGSLVVPLGAVRPGPQVRTALVPACAGGCRLAGISVQNGLADFSPRSGRLLFTGLAAWSGGAGPWHPVSAGFARAGRWGPSLLSAPVAGTRVTSAPGGLLLTYVARNAEVPGISPADVPAVLPAVLTRAAVARPRVGGTSVVTGLTGERMPVRVAAVVDLLPRALRAGTLIDLPYAQRVLGAGIYAPTQQVWLGPAAPPDVAARLQRARVDVVRSESIAGVSAALGREGPALALLLFLCAAALAALLSAGATVVSVYLAARRRAFEVAAMEAVGVPRGRLVRAGIGEQLLLLLSGVGTGIVAGILGAVLALPRMPLFVDETVPPPLHYLPSFGAVGGFLAAAVLLVAVAGALAAVLLVRSARPARLREVQA